MRFDATCLMALAAILAIAATADAAHGAVYKSSGDIQKACSEADPHEANFNPYSSGTCIGYIDGVVDGYEEMRNALSKPECVPDGTATKDVVRVVLDYLQAHPDELKELGARSIILAIKTRWSCSP